MWKMIISYWGSAYIKLTLKSVPQLTQETGRSLIYLRKHGSRTEVTDRNEKLFSLITHQLNTNSGKRQLPVFGTK